MSLTNWFNEQAFQSIVRWLLSGAGNILVANGLLTGEQSQVAGGAVMTLAMLVFSIISARTKSTAIKVLGDGSATRGKEIIADVKAGATVWTNGSK